MSKLEIIAKDYIRKINDNVYVLEAINSNSLESFNNEVIKYKDSIVKSNTNLSINDLALVRSISENVFPTSLLDRSLQEQGAKAIFYSPFSDFMEALKYVKELSDYDIGCSRDEIDIEDTKLSYPLYRNTKHFSLNGLVSDINLEFGKINFSNRNMIVIEPFADHLSDELLNLNPVDTFFNVKEKPFKIGNNGVFIIDYDTYKELILNPNIKNDLSKVKVFLYSNNNISLFSSRFTLQTYITDIVLAYLGYIPMHTIEQFKLYSDMCFENGTIYTDKEYIKKFQDLIEESSIKLLGKSYYNVPDEIKKTRGEYHINLPGIFHPETSYYKEENENNLYSRINTVKRYLDYLEKELGLDPVLSDKLFVLYSNRLIEMDYEKEKLRFNPIKLEKEIASFIEKVGYKRFIQVTKDFNNLPVDNKDKGCVK